MVQPPNRLCSPLLTLTILFISAAILTQHNLSPRGVHGWIPRGGGHMNINGQPNRASSTCLLMKKRDKKERKKKGNKEDQYSNDFDDVDGIGRIASANYISYNMADGFVARLEAMYEMETVGTSYTSILDNPKRTKIKAEDWSELAEGPCLGDCCGDDCDEQCEIPEDYKRFANKNAKVDVMSFLGIKRAEPLRVQRDWD